MTTPRIRTTLAGKATGPIEISFTSATTAHVATRAHVNDANPAVVFRDREWLVGFHFTMAEDGTWHTANDSRYAVTERARWREAPPSFAKAIAKECAAAVKAAATAEILIQAEQAHRESRRSLIDFQIAQAEAEIAERQSAIDALREQRAEIAADLV